MAHPDNDETPDRLRSEFETLLILRARAQRRVDDAPTFSPDWDAAMSHAEELDRRLDDLRRRLLGTVRKAASGAGDPADRGNQLTGGFE